ncbi:MAG TPA: hypothetical protein VGH81_01730 [Rudaea sp.]
MPEPAHKSVLLDFLPHALLTFRREPALAISVCYLLVAMAGIFYNFNFYERFGIPILTLSQISDFLVAGLQQPMALLLVLSTFPLCWAFDRFNASKRRARAARREMVLRTMADSPRRKVRLFLLGSLPRWFTGCVYVLLIVNYAWVFVHFYAKYEAGVVRQGDAPQVMIWLGGAAHPLAAQSKTWTYLGAVSNYVFVFDNAAGRSVILPINNIARIEPAPAKPGSAGVVVAPIP